MRSPIQGTTRFALTPAGRARRVGLGVELADFLRFVRRPRLGPRLPRRPGRARVLGGVRHGSQEWLGGISVRRTAAWLLMLWSVNLLLLGPLAAVVADSEGAEQRLSTLHLSWFHVVLWAPVMEEMVFRYALRRPAVGVWLLPIVFMGVLLGPGTAIAASMAIACAGVLGVMRSQGYRWSWRRLRRYRRWFPLLFHLATLVFAFLHLANFRLGAAGWLLPVLVLPQWATGLVLGWMRVRFGIGQSIVLHGTFNAGPMALLWTLQHYLPGWLDG